ncbi:TOM1-like protein 2 isoform X3 [Ictalurus punctatus]|uniref:TOM1-like protein 2 isoform X3 n=1 Tax=Ictalurus punctatus TaxID=7998 RepID=A0A2D0SBT1_ICTPU|nr:TOM1-like protein 2 isoform X3 [Ictalurus punctatus]
MEFLLGNPYGTPVGQCIEKATDGSLQSEDWTLNMEICDLINETEDGPKDAIRAVKKRLNGNKNYREVMLTLTVLETCVKNCGYRFHALVTTRDFIDGVLVKVISPKNNPPAIVQDKVLALIQLQSTSEVDPKPSAPAQPKPAHAYSAPPVQSPPQVPNMHMAGPINPTLDQISRLRSELDIVRGNTKVMSEMLTEMVPGQEDPSDHELLQELNRTCRAMQQRIVELISRVSNEEVTEELLHVNDDLNNIFLRYERYERFRSGRAGHGVNNGVLSEATDDNLIDLGPGSPAVVSPRISGTPPSSLPASVAPARSASPATLSSRLAGLDVGAESVSGTLSSLSRCQPLSDDFDMFAQTRSGTLNDQRKNPPFEDTQAASGAAPTLELRQQNSGGFALAQSSVMDDIEEWLCTDVKGDEGEEGVTSEEFDKFLEERAKAAEMVPTLPLTLSADPTSTAGSAVNAGKKPDRPEDSTFVL